MAPRSQLSVSTTSSSLYTEDIPPSIDVISLDNPSKMSPSAIRAELQFYGISLASDDRRRLEHALVSARLQRSGGDSGSPKKDGTSPRSGGGGDQQQQQTHQKQQYHNTRQGGSPESAVNLPGVRVKTPPSSQHTHTATGSAGNNPTHIPLTPNNRIPPQILNIIRTSADPSMRGINLDHRNLGDGEVVKLVEALESNRTVEFLSLRNCSISDVGIEKFGELLQRNDTLVDLHLDTNRICAEGAAALSTALITNETLQVLTLNENEGIGDKGVTYLIGALEHNTTIRTLEVNNCGISSSSPGASGAGCSASRGSRTSLNRLEKIDALLADRQIDSNFESLLERLLDDDFRVTGIDLSGRRIGDKGATRLAEALADNTQVRQLWLRGCNIGDDGARALAMCLEQNMAIVDLFLGNNNIGNAGLSAISDALASSNLTLVSLELDDNRVGEGGIDSFVAALEKNTSVLVASFENNPIGNTGKVALLQSKLAQKRNGLNLVSFVVDPDAGESVTSNDANMSGIVNMSVCSSYMPSTYRRAGFSSQMGGGPKNVRDSGTMSGGASNDPSHKYSMAVKNAQQQMPPPPQRQQAHQQGQASSPQQQREGSGSPKSNSSPPKQLAQQQAAPQPAPPPRQVAAQPKAKAPPPRPVSPPMYSRTNVYQKAHVPVPLKAQALDIIDEQSNEDESKTMSLMGSHMNKSSNALANSRLGPLVEEEQDQETAHLVPKRDAATVEQTTITAESIELPQTQRNFDITLKKLWRRVEMMKRTNHFAAAYYRARHFWCWFVPISSCMGLSVLLSLASAASTSARLGLSLFTGLFAFLAFGLNFLQARCGWSSRAEVHRSAEVELSQVAFRLDTLGKYEGRGLTTGSHSTKSRANAIRDLYRIDVYLQAMQRCTPPVPEPINEVFYLLASRLKGICAKYPNAVKLRSAYAFYDEDPSLGDNPVPVEMQIDALDLLGREIENYFLYPLFMPNPKAVVSRTIDIFFSKPEAATASGSGGENGGGGEASVDSRSFYSQEEDQEIV